MYDETQQNIKLLYKYLKKLYGEDTAKDLLHKCKDNLFGYKGLAWSLGKRSIEFFCMYFLQDIYIPKPNNKARTLAPVHYEMWREAEKMLINDEFDKLAMAEPRGTAKTTVMDTGVTTWAHCYEISRYTIVCGKTEQDSTEFIANVKHELEENERLKRAFGKLLDPKKYTVNKLELELTNNTKIQALSSTSSIRGKKYQNYRPSIIIADDYQGKADIITQEARDKKYSTWCEDSEYAGDEAVYRDGKKIAMATKFIVLGTILHRDCFMSRILKNSEYKSILRRVVDFDVDKFFKGEILEGELSKTSQLWGQFKAIYFNDKLTDSKAYAEEFYYQHEKDMQYETIWPDKYNCLSLAEKYYANSIAFKQEMMNDASKIGERWFKSVNTKPADEIETHTFIKTMLCVDPAVAVNKKADRTSILVGSEADNGFKYIRKSILDRLGFEDYCQQVVKLLIDFPDITHIDIEKNTYQGADVLRIKEIIEKTPELHGRSFIFINERATKNKDDRIATIVGAVNNGQIIINEEDKDSIEQLKNFAGQDFSESDDFPDNLARFDTDIKDIEVIENVQLFDKKLLGL